MQIGSLEEILQPLRFDDMELLALAEALERPPRPAIRLRPERRAEEMPFSVEPVGWHSRGFFVRAGIRPAAYVHYGAGDYYIQDAGSLLAVAALDAQPGETVCDLCAAPGGKATAILDSLERGGWLLANEAIQSRVSVLRLQLARYGVPRFALSQRDPVDLAELLGAQFDAVLVDAPCTGQSLVGRGKQTESAFQRQAIEHCAARQTRILEAAAQLVRPGGRLVYSTCTFAYAENEGQVERFLAAQPGWRSVSKESLVPWQSSVDPIGYRLWPHRHGVAGAFVAILHRLPGQSSEIADAHLLTAESPIRSAHLMRASRGRSSRSAQGVPLDEWGSYADAVFSVARDRCLAWPQQPPEVLQRAAVDGPEIAFLKGSTWYPAYGLAMCRDPHWQPHAAIELSDTEGAAYLQGDVIRRGFRGWGLARWRGRPLGWVKGDGSRAKNHLPKPARLTPPLTA